MWNQNQRGDSSGSQYCKGFRKNKTGQRSGKLVLSRVVVPRGNASNRFAKDANLAILLMNLGFSPLRASIIDNKLVINLI